MAQVAIGPVFMSYSRRDNHVMRRIVAFIRKRGIQTWIDDEKLIPGTPIWEEEIEKAIKGASAVIAILSPDAKNSEWVRREISLADQNRKRIFPVLVRGDEESSISLRLITRQYVDLRENETAGVNVLCNSLAHYLGELQVELDEKARERAEAESKAQEAQHWTERKRREEGIPRSNLEGFAGEKRLASEYRYIAQTATGANEAQARVLPFYLIAVGSLAGAMFFTQLFDPVAFSQTINLLLSGLFLLLALLGTSNIMQLARLRAAWFESMLAMNQIKDYMMSENEHLVQAFRWRTTTLPSKHTTMSVSYYQASEVAFISGVLLGTAIFLLLRAFFSTTLLHWIAAILLGLGTIYVQLAIYKRALR